MILNKIRLVADDYALVFLTKTGLGKSILDATAPVRTLLKSNNFHNFPRQLQGEEHKIKKDASFLLPDGIVTVLTSLYRPITKKGDTRIWFSGLRAFAQPNDVMALFFYRSALHVINISLIVR
jgi:hypothetical protein